MIRITRDLCIVDLFLSGRTDVKRSESVSKVESLVYVREV